MSSKERAKGNRVEREVVNRLANSGIDARRAWGSDGRSLGFDAEVDCIALINCKALRIQVKARKSIGKLYQPDTDKVDCHVVKMDRRKPVIIMELDKFIEIYKDAKSKNKG